MEIQEILVIGNEAVCSTCIGAPSSKETASWLEAFLVSRYGVGKFLVRYLDIHSQAPELDQFKEELEQEDLIYPLIVFFGRIISEGVPSPKKILMEIERFSQQD